MKKLKKIFAMLIAVLGVGTLSAQTWVAPVVGVSLNDVNDDTELYLYNVKADAFACSGMKWGSHAVVKELQNGDSKLSADVHRCRVTKPAGGQVQIMLNEKTYLGGGGPASTNDCWVDHSNNNVYIYNEVNTNTYTLKPTTATNESYLDCSWAYGGHITFSATNGYGNTEWAFVLRSDITSGKYLLYKAKKEMYDIYTAVVAAGHESTYAAVLTTANAAYVAADATAASVNAATRTLLKEVAPVLSSGYFTANSLFDNPDMRGYGDDTDWGDGLNAFGDGIFESWHSAETITQTQTGLPNGFYTVVFLGMYRQDGGDAAPTLTLTSGSNSAKANLKALTEIDFGDCDGANKWTSVDKPDDKYSAGEALAHTDAGVKVENFVVENGELTVTVAMPSGSQWLLCQGFQIYYKAESIEEYANLFNEAKTAAMTIDQAALNTYAKGVLTTALSNAAEQKNNKAWYQEHTAALNEATALANGMVQVYPKVNALVETCNGYAKKSEPATAEDLNTFNTTITKATADKETAATVDAMNEVYNALETARQAYVLKAYPTGDTTFDMTFLVDGVGNTTTGWTKNFSDNFKNNYQYQNNNGKDTETFKKQGYIEAWNNSVPFTGTLTYMKTGLPNGHYSISAYAFTDGTTSFTAQDKSVTVDNTGKYVKPVVEDVLVDDGTLTFGLKNEDGTWIGITNIELSLIGDLSDGEKLVLARTILKSTIDAATALSKNVNIGDGVFEIPKSAVTTLNAEISKAKDVYDNANAVVADLEKANTDLLTAIDTYKNVELKGPDADERFYITIATPGHGRLKCPVIAALGSVGTNNPTGYTFYAAGNFENYRPTVFTFTKVSGNLYNISVELEEGTVYLTYGSLNGSPASWNKSQIQGTTNVNAKGTFKIEASSVVDGGIRIVNTETGKYLDCENNADKNYPIYSGSHDTYEFALVDASVVTTSIVIDAEIQLATCVLLFDAELPSNLKAYTTETLENGYLNLVEVDKLEAYKPYILYAENGYEGELSGKVDLAGYQLKVTDDNGLLAGAVETQVITYGYALQNQTGENGKGVAFYAVDTENSQKVTIPAGKCWLDVQKNSTPAATTRSISLRFPEGGATGIGDVKIELPADGSAPIYTIDGKRVDVMQSGQIYIIGGKKMIKK